MKMPRGIVVSRVIVKLVHLIDGIIEAGLSGREMGRSFTVTKTQSATRIAGYVEL